MHSTGRLIEAGSTVQVFIFSIAPEGRSSPIEWIKCSMAIIVEGSSSPPIL
ncbi:MAG TPA: hypothetical protein VMT46_13205 [Anaerolineaceae bacterium]|nr:hypothetical protein [Anaerolineaceae bacterium]